ncbi:hypothetical protein DPMN_176575 [Dreissena polymorpha]|uniref:Uncharacterized protein n=1 Tax=Dreissena polymorpha TaxID=45954 RepID=A0A9D4IH16_DREPO|nr:hypothetical protein DPMN_176575 [Dreissena polymorpha]
MDPECIVINQRQLRSHLQLCLQNSLITDFPHVQKWKPIEKDAQKDNSFCETYQREPIYTAVKLQTPIPNNTNKEIQFEKNQASINLCALREKEADVMCDMRHNQNESHNEKATSKRTKSNSHTKIHNHIWTVPHYSKLWKQ